MNRLDSELITGQLMDAGHEFIDDPSKANVVLLNTCSVRAQAENKVYSFLGREQQRQLDPDSVRIVGVLGCMAQRQKDELKKRYKCVDIVCSPGQLNSLPKMIEDALGGRCSVASDPDRKQGKSAFAANKGIDALDLSRHPSTAPGSVQAFVRIMRGCDKFCSYCIVPFVRGPEISRPPQDIVDEVRKLVEAGRSEITLIGQTVNSYSHSCGELSVRFCDLLTKISPIEGLRRLRFVTSYPTDFGNDLLETMRDLPNICRYIHCPPQSGSDKILKAMKRRYSRGEYDDFIARTRSFMPDISLAGDFIVGFPGETEQDHQASADLIRQSGYKNSFVFKYSPRPGTVAAKTLSDSIPFQVKRRRNNELLDVQAEVGLEHHKQYIGKKVEVLIDGPSPRSARQTNDPADGDMIQMTARTPGDHITVFYGKADQAGTYADVQIADANSLTLFGELADVRPPLF